MKPILGDSDQDGKLSLGEFGREAIGGGYVIGGGASSILRSRGQRTSATTRGVTSRSVRDGEIRQPFRQQREV